MLLLKHQELRELVKRHNQDSVFGILPSNRWNVDQIPLAFAYDSGTTWDSTNTRRVWCKAPSKGLTKRQATDQLLISPENRAHATLIFRGQGNVLPKEKHLYDPRVSVSF